MLGYLFCLFFLKSTNVIANPVSQNDNAVMNNNAWLSNLPQAKITNAQVSTCSSNFGDDLNDAEDTVLLNKRIPWCRKAPSTDDPKILCPKPDYPYLLSCEGEVVGDPNFLQNLFGYDYTLAQFCQPGQFDRLI